MGSTYASMRANVRARDRSRARGCVVVSELLNLRANARDSVGIIRSSAFENYFLRDAARSWRAWASRREKQSMGCELTVCDFRE